MFSRNATRAFALIARLEFTRRDAAALRLRLLLLLLTLRAFRLLSHAVLSSAQQNSAPTEQFRNRPFTSMLCMYCTV